VVNFSFLFALLLTMFLFQKSYTSKHLTRRGFTQSNEKRNLYMVTGVFSLAILYRAVFNLVKLIWGTIDTNGHNDIDLLEA
jgi:hypothetical protein